MKRTKTTIVGLTGSIGMGKSTAAKMFARLGAQIFSADEVVHSLLSSGGAAEKKVVKAFPESKGQRGINRQKLFELVFDDDRNLQKLESILHPLVMRECQSFIAKNKTAQTKIAVLEIPLLFEAGFSKVCDFTVCVCSSSATQKERVLKRKGMTPAKLRKLLKRQWPTSRKRRLADTSINTDGGLAQTRGQIQLLWRKLCQEG